MNRSPGRSGDEFARGIVARAQSLSAPSPSPQLIERILADRAAGERVILPVDDVGAPRLAVRRLIAAGLTLVIGSASYFAWTNSRASDDVFLSELFLPASAEAAQLSAFPRLTGIDGRRLGTGQYSFSRVQGNRTTGRGTLRVSSSSDRGEASWRVEHEWTVEPGPSGVRHEVESLVVRQRDLRALKRTVHVAPYLRYSRLNITQFFTGDSVRGAMSAERNNKITVRRRIAQQLAPSAGPYASEAFAPVLLGSVNLHSDWKASLSLLGWAVVPDDVRYGAQLRVTGEERVRVPAGEFDCWRLEVSTSGVTHTYWVRKSDGFGVRTRFDRRRSPGGRGNHEIVLTAETK